MGGLHSPSLTVDLHLDCPWQFTKHGPFNLQQGSKHSAVTIPLMKKGRLDAVVFALYLSDGMQDRLGSSLSRLRINEQISWVRKQSLEHAFLGLEGGRLLSLDLKYLGQLSKAGVKYLTVIHNFNTTWADSATDFPKHRGLTKFGKTVVEECNKLGVLLDISHSSDDTAWSVINNSREPVIASHSACQGLVNHPRNLNDKFLRTLAITGGLVGIPFARRFLGSYSVADHIDYAVQLVGPKHVAIGSDLDGADMVNEVRDVSDWGKVVMDAMADRGYADTDIAAIAGGNALALLERRKEC